MTKPALALAFIYAFAIAGRAQSAIDRTDVEYGRPAGAPKPLFLDLHIPAGPGPFPAAILVHGGGFDEGSKSTNVRPLFDVLANAGYAWFSIDYRLAPLAHHADANEDLLTSIRWVRAHAAEFRLDRARLVLMGESAGGLLVNYAGTHQTPAAPFAAVVDFYGPTDYGRLSLDRKAHPERFNMASINRHASNGGGIRYFGVQQLDEAGLAKLRSAAPVYAVHKGMPPFLCIHGTKDDQVPFDQSTTMCEAMKKAGASCELITIENGGHGWRDASMQHWKAEMVAWLNRVLKTR